MFSVSGHQASNRRGKLDPEQLECESMSNLWDKDGEINKDTYKPQDFLDLDLIEEYLLENPEDF